MRRFSRVSLMKIVGRGGFPRAPIRIEKSVGKGWSFLSFKCAVGNPSSLPAPHVAAKAPREWRLSTLPDTFVRPEAREVSDAELLHLLSSRGCSPSAPASPGSTPDVARIYAELLSAVSSVVAAVALCSLQSRPCSPVKDERRLWRLATVPPPLTFFNDRSPPDDTPLHASREVCCMEETSRLRTAASATARVGVSPPFALRNSSFWGLSKKISASSSS